MKLKEYLEKMGPGEELTCWDTVVDSEFYFYSKDEDDEDLELDVDFAAVDACMDKLAARLDVVKIHDGGVEVNLYEMLEHPKVIQFAKDNFYLPHQYEDDDDIVMLLFDDNDSNITNGFIEFSKDMVQCLEQAYGPAGEKYPIAQIKELEKHVDGEEHMRVAVAKLGIALDRFVSDESWQVRKAVAEQGYGLDILKDDPHWAVRKAVAKFAPEALMNDGDWRVVEAARGALRAQAKAQDSVNGLIADAHSRSGANAVGKQEVEFERG